jgi:hypothetical protein
MATEKIPATQRSKATAAQRSPEIPQEEKVKPDNKPPTLPAPPTDQRGRKIMSYEDHPAPPSPIDYFPDEIVLYGVQLNGDSNRASLPFGDKRLRLEVYNGDGQIADNKYLAIAVIYSYSYEGACYRLDRPRLMIISAKAKDPEGCGYGGTKYKMWRIDSKHLIMELNSTVDLAEHLILEANLPGNRAPNTYGNNMAMAHRGNRLSRNGG